MASHIADIADIADRRLSIVHRIADCRSALPIVDVFAIADYRLSIIH